MSESVLVLAAHPDDEVLGCGGTIARMSAQGARVHVAFLADGVTARAVATDVELQRQSQELSARRQAAQKAAAILGVHSISFANFPDNRMDSVALLDVVKEVEALVAAHRPLTVLTHHAGDLNVDHRRTHEAVVTACRPQRGHPVKTLLCFEVASSTEWQLPGSAATFAPNWFVDVSSFFERKKLALDAYAAEMREWPHPRSLQGVEHLARWRGAVIGVEAAEAFVLGRHLS